MKAVIIMAIAIVLDAVLVVVYTTAYINSPENGNNLLLAIFWFALYIGNVVRIYHYKNR